MPRRRKAYSRSAMLEEEEEAMEEEAAAEEDLEDVEDGDEDGLDDEDECGGKGRGGRERPGQRNAANARERARMRVLSRAFCRLKTTLPWVPPDTKLSKLDTLRLATSYIAHLRAMLAAEAESAAAVEVSKPESPDRGRVSTLHPLNLTWPFSFQRSSSSSSSPASSTSSNISSSLTSGQTGLTSLGDEWSSVPMQTNQYCQDNQMAMDSRGPQNRMSPPTHHHMLHHHHHPHHFLPSSYPDSSLLHIA